MEMHDFERTLLEKVGYSLTSLQLRNHVEEVEIGVNDDEQGVKQRIRFDVDVHLAGAHAPIEDEIDQVLDYDFIKARISDSICGGRINLLESLVAHLLDDLLQPHGVVAATVTATKLDVYSDRSEIGCKMMRINP